MSFYSKTAGPVKLWRLLLSGTLTSSYKHIIINIIINNEKMIVILEFEILSIG